MRKSDKKAQLEPPMVVSADKAAEVFPAVRYFQIHFEFLQEQIQLILHNQESIQQRMQQLENRLLRSGPDIRFDTRSMHPLERLTTNLNATQDNEISNGNQTSGR